MMTRRHLLATTAIGRFVAFDTGNGFPPLRGSGTVNRNVLTTIYAAAERIANQDNVTLDTVDITDDLTARSVDSEWMLPYWDLTDDLVSGYEAVKAQGQKYLPKFGDETQADYDARLGLTKMTNVYRDVIETLSGKPFEEEIAFADAEKADEQIKLFVDNVDGAGNNLTAFAAATFFNGINSAIDWIYVDYPNVAPGTVRSLKDLKDQGIRPFWSHVLGRNILEAQSQVVQGKETLVYIRILEPGEKTHVRIFERNGDNVQWALFVEELRGDRKVYHLVENGTISIGVIPLVPFITGRRDGRSFKFYPVMRDAADLQIDLYQSESGLKFAKTMTAYPMLAANGIKPIMEVDGKTPKRLAVGPSKVLYSIPDGLGNAGTWGYVSPEPGCLNFLKDSIKETMDQLRELGRQPLTAQSGNLTVITTAYAAGKAKSAVAAWGMRLKEALETALVMTCAWLAIKDYKPDLKIFDEYDDFATDQAADLTALKDMRANKDLSQEDYIIEMKRRSVLRADFDNVKNLERLLDETPSDDETALDDGAGDTGAPGDKIDPAPPGKKPKPKNVTA